MKRFAPVLMGNLQPADNGGWVRYDEAEQAIADAAAKERDKIVAYIDLYPVADDPESGYLLLKLSSAIERGEHTEDESDAL